jgi:hypothetical protein
MKDLTKISLASSKIDQIRAQNDGSMIWGGVNKVYEYYKKIGKELSLLTSWLYVISRNWIKIKLCKMR